MYIVFPGTPVFGWRPLGFVIGMWEISLANFILIHSFSLLVRWFCSEVSVAKVSNAGHYVELLIDAWIHCRCYNSYFRECICNVMNTWLKKRKRKSISEILYISHHKIIKNISKGKTIWHKRPSTMITRAYLARSWGGSRGRCGPPGLHGRAGPGWPWSLPHPWPLWHPSGRCGSPWCPLAVLSNIARTMMI